MGVEDWSTDEAQNVSLEGYDVSRGEAPDVSTSEHARIFMAKIKALSDSVDERLDNFVGENIEVDGVSIVNNDGTLTVVDVAIDGDTEDLLTEKIAEIEAAAETASGKASDAATAAEQAAASASAAVGSVSSAVDAANAAAAQASLAAQAAARAQSGAAMADSAVQAVVAGTNLNWQKSDKAASVTIYPVPETALEPVAELLFTETDPAEGSKGPTNPSSFVGISSIAVTRCETAGVDETQYTVDLGGTYYGGTLDVSTGLLTVTHMAAAIRGESTTWRVTTKTSVRAFFTESDILTPGISVSAEPACTHFPFVGDSSDQVHFRLYSNGGIAFFYPDIEATTSDFDAFLEEQYANGTPVTVVYTLSNPIIVQLAPQQILALPQADKYTPRLNTVSIDAGEVQVGYAKSPIRSEYELTQAIIATEGGE